MKNLIPIYHPQSGESLLEVLMSLLIFSFAILGLLGTQQRMMLQLFETESALIANQFSINLAEQIGGLDTMVITQLDGSTNPVSQLSCPVDQCNSYWLNAQLSNWRQQLEQKLPNSHSLICLDDSPADGFPEAPACGGSSRLAVKIWPQNQRYPMVSALDL
ncbi:MAG: hypothetical protein L3J22_09835 [Xanthomonadales bacterium]|nr:hypothetical protein [Xanthomonadales bacterium]